MPAWRWHSKDWDVTLMFEPGRVIAGNSGVLLTETLWVKPGATHPFVIVDAAMNDLIRPSLYDAYHGIVPVAEPAADAAAEPYDVVGPVCESGDTFAVQRPLPPLADDDLVAILSAGAYGAVMASTYNSRPLVPEVLVDGDKWHVIRPRKSIEELIALDSVPDWV